MALDHLPLDRLPLDLKNRILFQGCLLELKDKVRPFDADDSMCKFTSIHRLFSAIKYISFQQFERQFNFPECYSYSAERTFTFLCRLQFISDIHKFESLLPEAYWSAVIERLLTFSPNKFCHFYDAGKFDNSIYHFDAAIYYGLDPDTGNYYNGSVFEDPDLKAIDRKPFSQEALKAFLDYDPWT